MTTEVLDALAALDRRVTALEDRAERETGFRMSIESDLATIKTRQAAQGQMLQALHLTQSEHTGRLNAIEAKLDEHGRVLAEHGLKLSALEGGVDRIIGMLDTLIARER
ncbi:hypothetical protein [Cryptosporangium aurantiacum]|uniref:Uncharacterized protein n=1 Tax=Cryptosporangium aurantiacum TaxID=134849 RepID=A0A1M7QFT8_9ACTN|nr:hypothetical protein [Cryptosporangium aurantiacum]SHN29778.1 hypothetical protein SAMN05443668_104611 [Cryptosporangium aurantiacum]